MPSTGDDLGIQMAVLATEVRLSKEELGRRFDEQHGEFRAMRAEMTNNYMSIGQHNSDVARLSDRIGNVESDVVDVRTSLATQFVNVHGHIDRRFDEIAQQAKEQRESSRWSVGLVVAVGAALLGSATSIILAFVSMQ